MDKFSKVGIAELYAVYDAIAPIPRAQFSTEIRKKLEAKGIKLSVARLGNCLKHLADEHLLWTRSAAGYLIYDPSLPRKKLVQRLDSAVKVQKRPEYPLTKKQVLERLKFTSEYTEKPTQAPFPAKEVFNREFEFNKHAPEIFKVQITGRGMELKMDALEIKFTDEGIFIKK